MTAAELAERLQRLDADGFLHFVAVAAGDPNLDRSTFPKATECGLGALDHGQVDDLRYSIDGLSLHELRYRDHSLWHLDRVDGCESPVRHFIADTDAPIRAVIGAMIGAAATAVATRKPRWILAGAGVGLVAGGLTAGARGTIRRVELEDLLVA